jgi:hypothetical protein
LLGNNGWRGSVVLGEELYLGLTITDEPNHGFVLCQGLQIIYPTAYPVTMAAVYLDHREASLEDFALESTGLGHKPPHCIRGDRDVRVI